MQSSPSSLSNAMDITTTPSDFETNNQTIAQQPNHCNTTTTTQSAAPILSSNLLDSLSKLTQQLDRAPPVQMQTASAAQVSGTNNFGDQNTSLSLTSYNNNNSNEHPSKAKDQNSRNMDYSLLPEYDFSRHGSEYNPFWSHFLHTYRFNLGSKENGETRLCTHTGMDGKRICVPDTELDLFLQAIDYSIRQIRLSKICEILNPAKFRFFGDCDLKTARPVSREFIMKYSRTYQRVMRMFFPEGNHQLIVCSTESELISSTNSAAYYKSGIHWIWPAVIVNLPMALVIATHAKREFELEYPAKDFVYPCNLPSEQIDLLPYRARGGGLRLVHNAKMQKCDQCKNREQKLYDCVLCKGAGMIEVGRVYKPFAVLNDDGSEDLDELQRLQSSSLYALRKSCIRLPVNFQNRTVVQKHGDGTADINAKSRDWELRDDFFEPPELPNIEMSSTDLRSSGLTLSVYTGVDAQSDLVVKKKPALSGENGSDTSVEQPVAALAPTFTLNPMMDNTNSFSFNNNNYNSVNNNNTINNNNNNNNHNNNNNLNPEMAQLQVANATSMARQTKVIDGVVHPRTVVLNDMLDMASLAKQTKLPRLFGNPKYKEVQPLLSHPGLTSVISRYMRSWRSLETVNVKIPKFYQQLSSYLRSQQKQWGDASQFTILTSNKQSKQARELLIFARTRGFLYCGNKQDYHNTSYIYLVVDSSGKVTHKCSCRKEIPRPHSGGFCSNYESRLPDSFPSALFEMLMGSPLEQSKLESQMASFTYDQRVTIYSEQAKMTREFTERVYSKGTVVLPAQFAKDVTTLKDLVVSKHEQLRSLQLSEQQASTLSLDIGQARKQLEEFRKNQQHAGMI
jgi:hypothetical protein